VTDELLVVDCKKCGRAYAPSAEPDPCIGMLPGVVEACCGHGNDTKAYVMFENGVLFRGIRRIEHHDLTRKRRKPA